MQLFSWCFSTLEYDKVMETFSEQLVEDGRIDVNRRHCRQGPGSHFADQLPPLGEIVVAEGAGHVVAGVGGPVEQRNSLLREKSLPEMILDDDLATRNSCGFAQQELRLMIMVQHVGQNDG